ncbi:MAG: DNA alkylation repair protein [Ignavibacteriaceae bacterium]|nr:DNA alkylation repair protein [Ignavibacteriaceae bacterium]
MTFKQIKEKVNSLSDPDQAEILQRFFKTGRGEYGEGDVFAGIKLPVQRKIAKENSETPISELKKMLLSPVHEIRMIALIILTNRFARADEVNKKIIFDFYIENREKINNWDLVDISAPKIPGEFLFDKDKKILYDFARSKNIWERRIAIISTFGFIRKNHFEDTIQISKILLKDKEDLIHKAVGWMLRETGKRNLRTLELFLKEYYKTMPRTMLRYAIEKFPEHKRQNYLKGKIQNKIKTQHK